MFDKYCLFFLSSFFKTYVLYRKLVIMVTSKFKNMFQLPSDYLIFLFYWPDGILCLRDKTQLKNFTGILGSVLKLDYLTCLWQTSTEIKTSI